MHYGVGKLQNRTEKMKFLKKGSTVACNQVYSRWNLDCSFRMVKKKKKGNIQLSRGIRSNLSWPPPSEKFIENCTSGDIITAWPLQNWLQGKQRGAKQKNKVSREVSVPLRLTVFQATLML